MTDNRWSKRTHPEIFCFGVFSDFDQDSSICEFSGEVGDEAREDDPRSRTKDRIIGILIGPFRIRRNTPDRPRDERKKKQWSKTGPDDLSGFFDPIDLREDISEDIGEREDDGSSIEGKWSDIDELHARDIGDDEGSDEESGDDGEHRKRIKNYES